MRCTATVTTHRPSPFATAVVVDVDGTVVRGLPIWSITDLLDCDDQVDAAFAVSDTSGDQAEAALDPGTLDDIISSRLIAPPRRRHRRDRAVSSRAVFYQAGYQAAHQAAYQAD